MQLRTVAAFTIMLIWSAVLMALLYQVELGLWFAPDYRIVIAWLLIAPPLFLISVAIAGWD